MVIFSTVAETPGRRSYVGGKGKTGAAQDEEYVSQEEILKLGGRLERTIIEIKSFEAEKQQMERYGPLKHLSAKAGQGTGTNPDLIRTSNSSRASHTLLLR